jgi:hypothetical protein
MFVDICANAGDIPIREVSQDGHLDRRISKQPGLPKDNLVLFCLLLGTDFRFLLRELFRYVCID